MSVKTKCGKQRSQNAELKTENRKTLDAKPKTHDTGLETDWPRGPNFQFSVSGSGFCWITSVDEPANL
jgi:hypothetical protein